MSSQLLMSLEILRRAAGLLEARRKKKWEAYNRILAELLVWVIGLFELMNYQLEDKLIQHYPGCCPYCGEKPCACDINNKGERRSITPSGNLHGLSVNEWQVLLREIYPNAGMSHQTAADKIVEEVAEMATAAKEGQQDKSLEEAVDAIARLFAAANQQDIELGSLVEKLFPGGRCCSCKHSPCVCSDERIVHNYRP